MLATTILAKVDGQRLQRAVEGVVSGAYAFDPVEQSDQELRGFVTNGDRQTYGVVLTDGSAFCSCKDAVALALYVIRQPQPAQARAAEAR